MRKKKRAQRWWVTTLSQSQKNETEKGKNKEHVFGPIKNKAGVLVAATWRSVATLLFFCQLTANCQELLTVILLSAAVSDIRHWKMATEKAEATALVEISKRRRPGSPEMVTGRLEYSIPRCILRQSECGWKARKNGVSTFIFWKFIMKMGWIHGQFYMVQTSVKEGIDEDNGYWREVDSVTLWR